MSQRDQNFMSEAATLADTLLEAAKTHAELPALKVDGETYTYSAIFAAAQRLAIDLRTTFSDHQNQPPVVAVWGTRHVSSYVAILATVLAGGCYVPLNCRHPPERNRDILRRTGALILLHHSSVENVIADLTRGMSGLRAVAVLMTDVGQSVDFCPARVNADQTAYILFTSGSTGKPKGVPISHGNLLAYLRAARECLSPRPQDKLSQTFDLTFDVSIHDVFLAFTSGAQLCVASISDLQRPAGYIQRDQITMWSSVPSLGYILRDQGDLVPDAFPSLRMSMFCGEALPKTLVQDWTRAAPKSAIENWYGPTEATIVCIRHVVIGAQGQASSMSGAQHDMLDQSASGIVPIGEPIGKMQCVVLDQELAPVADGSIGRLFVTGPQISAGYLDEHEQTAEKFHNLPERAGIYYDTGDLVRAIEGSLHFVGRSDSQVKIRGYRIELAEIESALRKVVGGGQVLVLPWPRSPKVATHLIGIVEDVNGLFLEPAALREKLRASLPDYMIPANIFTLPSFTKNTSGKLDRNAIGSQLDAALQTNANLTTASDSEMRPGDLETQVLEIIVSLRPTLDHAEILRAPSLIWAGLDSMNLVNLAVAMEQQFDVELDADTVAAIGVMGFEQIIAFLKAGRLEVDVFDGLPPDKVGRANRAIDFVQALPGILRTSTQPLIMAVGSSGTMRGFRADVAELEAARSGRSIMAFNVGLPAINMQGLSRICRHIASTCRAENVILAGVLYELDPMVVSTQPPKGDIMLHEAIFEGKPIAPHDSPLMPEFLWERAAHGDVEFGVDSVKRTLWAKWERARDFAIDDAYHGRMPFDQRRIDDWLEGAHYLKQITEQFVTFVHPLQKGERMHDLAEGSLYMDLIAQLADATSEKMILPESFELAADHFMNINHMEPVKGSTVFTQQLMQQFWTCHGIVPLL